MSRENQNWNVLNEKNIADCLKLIDQLDFELLQIPYEVQDFILNISSNHQCDPKVLSYAILSGIRHFFEFINVNNIKTK